jgi:hypothetical protein
MIYARRWIDLQIHTPSVFGRIKLFFSFFKVKKQVSFPFAHWQISFFLSKKTRQICSENYI